MSVAGLVPRQSNLSRTIYGTVMHHALQILETEHHAGNSRALEIAKSTFAYYWTPDNMPELASHHPELVHGIDEWLPRDTYGGMRNQGLKALDDYYALLTTDDGELLALELTFKVPVDLGDVGIHILTGTLDRLAVRKFRSKKYLSIEDFKTGKQPTYLRYNVQWTAYSYAARKPEFWVAWDDEAAAMHARFAEVAHRGRWIDIRLNKVVDAGWRGEQDYARLTVALREYVKAVNADVYPLTMAGDVCLYCPFRDGTCGGVPVPDEDAGRPM